MNVQHTVYILASRAGCLYIGVANDLHRRLLEHKELRGSEFSSKYKTTKLVYFESFQYIDQAIQREKQLKRWARRKKLSLIKMVNPELCDLSSCW